MEETISVEETVGTRIRDLRKARHFTLEQLAERACVSKSVLSKIENGKVQLAYLDVFPDLLGSERIPLGHVQ